MPQAVLSPASKTAPILCAAHVAVLAFQHFAEFEGYRGQLDGTNDRAWQRHARRHRVQQLQGPWGAGERYSELGDGTKGSRISWSEWSATWAATHLQTCRSRPFDETQAAARSDLVEPLISGSDLSFSCRKTHQFHRVA
jgi:hypothetical protein